MTPTPELVDAVARLLERCSRQGDCLIGPAGPGRYTEVKYAGRRLGGHVAVVLAAGIDVPDGSVVRHTCDTPGCVEATHLHAGTQSQNVHDEYERRRRVGGWARGDARPNAKMTSRDVIAMRRLARAGQSLGQIVEEFGFGYSSVRSAVRGETWEHVTSEPAVPGRRNQVGNPFALRLTRQADATRAVELAAAGNSLEQIAHHLDVSRHTAWKLLQVGRAERSA